MRANPASYCTNACSLALAIVQEHGATDAGGHRQSGRFFEHESADPLLEPLCDQPCLLLAANALMLGLVAISGFATDFARTREAAR